MHSFCSPSCRGKTILPLLSGLQFLALLACRCKSIVTSSHPAQSDLRHKWISKSTSVTGEGGPLFEMSSYLRNCRMDESRCIERPGRWCRFCTNVLLSYAMFMSYVYMHQCVVLYHLCSSIFMSCVIYVVLWRINSLREAMRVARNGSSQAQLARITTLQIILLQNWLYDLYVKCLLCCST